MGRRSINTTKSGKYMNPTDQARKEARKKELKKNKRQRQMVRAAVLKNKDPAQILEEMEKIDEMEYNCLQPSPLNEKVLRDKRKKLRETFDRVMRLYHTDEPDLWAELKRKEVEYEKKRLKKQQYYESVKHAQSVQIDDIPLPSANQTTPTVANSSSSSITTFPTPNRPPPPTALSLPPFAPGAPPMLHKKNELSQASKEKSAVEVKKKEPSVPSGPPPNLFDLHDLDTDAEDDEVVLKEYNPKSSKAKKVPKPNSLQQRMLAISGQNIDEFMKEMENVHMKKEKEREAAVRTESSRVSDGDDESRDSINRTRKSDDEEDNTSISESSDDESDDNSSTKQRSKEKHQLPPATLRSGASAIAIPLPPTNKTMPVVPAPPSAHLSIPGPPLAPMTGISPQSMLFRPPPLRPPGMSSFMPRPPMMPPARMAIRMPPGPPPGVPPRMLHHHKMPQQQLLHKDNTKGVTTITAKPQIRNLSADVTRFVPSTLRVKREDSRKLNRTKFYAESKVSTVETSKAATKDDAYMQFMNEMQGLL